MSLKQWKAADKTVSEILACAQQLIDVAKRAAQEGGSFDSVERQIWKSVKQMGHMALELFIHLQGNSLVPRPHSAARGDSHGATVAAAVDEHGVLWHRINKAQPWRDGQRTRARFDAPQ